MASNSYFLAAVSDTVRVWDTPSAPLNASTPATEQLQPRPVFSVKGATNTAPRLTCWNGAFDTLATLYDSHIVTHDKSGAVLEEVKLPGNEEVNT